MPTVLGRETDYPRHYAPELLDPLPRRRQADAAFGEDIWNHYEVSWLDSGGYPQVAILCARLGSGSERLIESKSMKLYFNSLNQTRFDSVDALLEVIRGDLDGAAGGAWVLDLSYPLALDQSADELAAARASVNMDKEILHADAALWRSGSSVDGLARDITDDQRELLAAVTRDKAERCELLKAELQTDDSPQQVLMSNLLKTNCPVTGQPDWASLLVVVGAGSRCKLKPESLLNYITSYREHEGFHEQCVESVFADVSARLGADTPLFVYARYTRRGGIDINPWRSNKAAVVDNVRLIRQ